MPSRRKLKKLIKSQTNLIIEDAFVEAINGDEKEAEKMDGVIDSLIDKRFELLAKVSQYPNSKGKEVQEHFSSLKSDFNKSIEEYTKKVGRVG